MKKFSYQDISKQINYDVVEVLEVKLVRVEARKKKKKFKENYLLFTSSEKFAFQG